MMSAISRNLSISGAEEVLELVDGWAAVTLPFNGRGVHLQPSGSSIFSPHKDSTAGSGHGDVLRKPGRPDRL